MRSSFSYLSLLLIYTVFLAGCAVTKPSPESVPPPDVTQPLDERPLGGMGIHLMRQLMDEVTHRATPQGGNELTMIKKGVI